MERARRKRRGEWRRGRLAAKGVSHRSNSQTIGPIVTASYVPDAQERFNSHPLECRGSRGCVFDHGKWSQILISNTDLSPEL